MSWEEYIDAQRSNARYFARQVFEALLEHTSLNPNEALHESCELTEKWWEWAEKFIPKDGRK